MKSYGVTIQIKLLQHYFHTVPLVMLYVVLTLVYVDEFLLCEHSKEASSTVFKWYDLF